MEISGLLIDPHARRVTQICFGPGNALHQLQERLGCNRVVVVPWVVGFGDRRSLLCRGVKPGGLGSKPGFRAHSNVIVGTAVLVGPLDPLDNDGNDKDATWIRPWTVEETLAEIDWVNC